MKSKSRFAPLKWREERLGRSAAGPSSRAVGGLLALRLLGGGSGGGGGN